MFNSYICISEVCRFSCRSPDMSSMIGCCNLQIIPYLLLLWLCHIQSATAALNCLLKTQPSVIQMMDLKSYWSPVSPLDFLCSCIAVHYFQSATYSMNCKYPLLQVSVHLLFRHTSPILSVLSVWLKCIDLGALFLFGATIVQKQNWCLKASTVLGPAINCTPPADMRALSQPELSHCPWK